MTDSQIEKKCVVIKLLQFKKDGRFLFVVFSLFNNRLKTSLVLVLTSSKKIIDTSIALAKMHLFR